MRTPDDDRVILAKALALGLTVLCQIGVQSVDYLAMQSAFRRMDFTDSERDVLLAEAAASLDRLMLDENRTLAPRPH